MTLTAYGRLCTEVYELTKPVSGQYADVPYFIQHLSQIGGKILEGMVGTGHLLIPLLAAGLHVEGIDTSPYMLATCQQNCANRGLNPVLYEGSIERLSVPGKFSAIVVTFGSFMLLGNHIAAIAARQALTQHLEPNGQIFVDLGLPVASLKAAGTVIQKEPVHCLDGSVILMQTSSTIDWIQQIEHIYIRYEKWNNGRLVDTELQHLPLHWFGPKEFKLLMYREGYRNITLCANYQNGLTPNSNCDQLRFSATIGSSTSGL